MQALCGACRLRYIGWGTALAVGTAQAIVRNSGVPFLMGFFFGVPNSVVSIASLTLTETPPGRYFPSLIFLSPLMSPRVCS